jgi:hypothetical protein
MSREKREDRCPERVVAGKSAERNETRFEKRLGVPGIFLQGIQILGLHTNEGVSCQNPRLVRGPAIVKRQDIEAGRRVRF